MVVRVTVWGFFCLSSVLLHNSLCVSTSAQQQLATWQKLQWGCGIFLVLCETSCLPNTLFCFSGLRERKPSFPPDIHPAITSAGLSPSLKALGVLSCTHGSKGTAGLKLGDGKKRSCMLSVWQHWCVVSEKLHDGSVQFFFTLTQHAAYFLE